MARGIHLKQLKSADLHAIGVPSDKMGETADGENEWPLSLLAEADPVLSRTSGRGAPGFGSDPFAPGRGPDGKPLDANATIPGTQGVRRLSEASPQTIDAWMREFSYGNRKTTNAHEL